MKIQNKGTLVFLICILVGLVIGGVIGDMFKSSLPILSYGKSIGVNTFTVDLAILKLSFGIKMQINLAGIIGLAISLFIFKRM